MGPSPAEQAFAEYLSLCESEDADFEAFCGRRPELAGELRRLHTGWTRAAAALAPPAGAAEDPALPEPGEERYEVLGEVGRGGMGVVLRVRDRYLRRTLAMKVLHEGRTFDRRATSRFLEEAQVTGQLEHPGIVPIYDLGIDREGRVYYTMPLVRGRDGARIFELARAEEEGWSRTRALGVLLRVCEAAAAAHARGVVHRDLKPSNILVGPYEEVYVVDWGLARVLSAPGDEDAAPEPAPAQPARVGSARREAIESTPDSSLGTVAGQVVGTPSYMAPEQARCEPIDARSDVYAVGAMLYLLLTGRRPYGDADGEQGAADTLQMLLDGPPTPVQRLAADVPPELAAICEKAMAREPRRRYADMGALAQDLRAFLERRVVAAYRTGALAELKKWVGRNRAAALASAVAVLLLVAGLISSLVLKSRSDENARRASSNFEAALGAVDRMLARVGQVDLSDVPHAEPVRRALLLDALEFYEGFLAEQAGDPMLRVKLGQAKHQVAQIHEMLGDTAEAERTQQEALEEYRSLAASRPDDDELRWRIAYDLYALGRIRYNTGRRTEAKADYLEALAAMDDLVGAHPERLDYANTRARILNALGVLQMADREADQAEQTLQAGIAAAEALDLGGYDVRQLLPEVLNNYAVHLLQMKRFDEARGPLTRAIELRAGAFGEGQATREDRVAQILALTNLGILLAQTEPENPDGGTTLRKALDLARSLSSDFPSVPAYRGRIAMALMNVANWTSDQGQHEEALALHEEARRECLAALESAPEDEELRRTLAMNYQNIYWTLRSLGRYREIAERADSARAVRPGQPLPYGRISATAMAYCAELVEKDESLDPAERQALRETYVAAMVRRFRELAEQGYRDPAYLEKEWFQTLRDHPEVVRLVEELSRETP